LLREEIKNRMKEAMLKKEADTLATIRLILAAIKDKDISARTEESKEGISDEQILSLFGSMIKQRKDSIDMYIKGGRQDLADKEQAEIDVIYSFMPKQLSDEEVAAAVTAAIAETGASSIKDMGKIMAVLKAKYAGQMDFAKASGTIKAALN
jgi:uncharacterized protein YqeY